ncbi:MAG TPA: hypothetical protein VEA80_20125 [Vitreimonas sp.]|uniref:hypothetical protein n=1 Tax=Vitreimonas sp. TaxID=3069702 RepID=UPI002D617FFD|nr:hypothetical protein [Vitreimonas sp.]HYD89798.1 hypothetical protein [Vitreimonas sp.]
MLQQDRTASSTVTDSEIARYDVSEDGVNWRPYDPKRDRNRLLHKRIEFAPLTSKVRGN